MGFEIFTFGVVFLLIVSGGLLLFYREEMIQRITEVITPHPKQKCILSTIQKTGLSIGGVVEHFYGSKVLTPLLLCALVMGTGLGSYAGPFMYIVALGVGFLAPDFWLGRQITKRQSKIRRGLPDVLDLLVICIEAGLSLDQGTARTAEELKGAQPELCDELHIVVLEQRAGRPRGDAWKHLAERTGVDCVRNTQNPARAGSGGGGGKDHYQAAFSACAVHFPLAFCSHFGSGVYFHHGVIFRS